MTKKGNMTQTGVRSRMTREEQEAFLRLLIYVNQDENKTLALDYVQHWLSASADNPAKDYFNQYVKENRPADISEYDFFLWATSTETRLAFLEYAGKKASADLKAPKKEKKPWEEMLDALKGEKAPLKGSAYMLHDTVTKALLDRTQESINKKRAVPALPREGILSYIRVKPSKGQPAGTEAERALDYGEWGYMLGYIRLFHSGRKNNIITPAMLYRAANGIEDGSDVSEGHQDEARAFMTWCHTHDIIINKQEEYRRRLELATEKGNEKELERLSKIIGNPEKLGLITDHLLDFVEHIDPDLFKETGEVKAICWEPGRPPALEQSALISGQLTSTPTEVLDIREVKTPKGKEDGKEDGGPIIGRRLQNNRERMNIKFYLLDAVRIRNTGEKWPITIEDLIKQGLPGHAAGKDNLPKPTDKQRRQYREYARDVLTYWQAIGYINNFRYVRGEEKFIINEEPPKKKSRKKTPRTGH